MKQLELCERLSIREVKGKIEEEKQGRSLGFSNKVTFYTISYEKGKKVKKFNCAMASHDDSPKIGDKIIVQTRRWSAFAEISKCKKYFIRNPLRRWEEIVEYEIL